MALSKREKVSRLLRRLEEFEPLILLGAAVVIFILDLVDFLPVTWLPSVTIGMLAILAHAMVRVRLRLEEVIRKVARDADSFFNPGPAHDIKAGILGSRDVLLSGTTLTRTLRNHLSDLKALVASGGNLRIILLNPESPYAAVAAMRYSQTSYQDYQENYIRGSLSDVSELLQISGGKVEIRLANYPFSFGALLFDSNSPNASLHLRYYSYRSSEGEGPYFNLYPSDDPWYGYFLQEVENIWKDSVQYPRPNQ